MEQLNGLMDLENVREPEFVRAQMYRLIDLERDDEIGVINEDQVQFLIDNLEEEGVEDGDYYVDEEVLGFLAENAFDEELMTMLSEALEGRVSLDIRYEVM